MSKKAILNNCALDLQRAAYWYYLNPKGKTHFIFIKHALGLLEKLKTTPRIKKSLEKIKEIKKELSNCSESNIYLADKILTIGCLLKE
jgi:hypothetical protein